MKFADYAGPAAKLAAIRPPGPSYAEWDRFLEQCREAGVAALDSHGKSFAGPLGFALLRRWRWLQDSRERNIPYAQAEAAFAAAIERDRTALRAAASEADQRRRDAMAERDAKKRRRPGRPQDGHQPEGEDDFFDYATSIGI